MAAARFVVIDAPPLGSAITTVARTPGRLVQSVAESSFDTWIKFYQPDENTPNSAISYYTKGAVVAFLLDARIRHVGNAFAPADHAGDLLDQQLAFPVEPEDAAGLIRSIWPACLAKMRLTPSPSRMSPRRMCSVPTYSWCRRAASSRAIWRTLRTRSVKL